MLSENALREIKLTLGIGARLHSHPLVWDELSQSVKVTSVPLWKWKIVTGLMAVYMSYSVARFLEAFVLEGKELHQCIILIYYCITHIYFNSIQQNLHFRRDEVASFITKFIHFDKASASEEKNGVRSDKVGITFRYFSLLGYGHACFQGIGFLYFSGSKNFLYSVFMDLPGFRSIPVKIFFALFEIFYATQCWTVTLLNTYILFATLENIAMWNQHVCTRNSWLEGMDRYYKCLNLVVSGFNLAMGPMVMPWGQICVLLEATICLYGTIRFYGIIPLAAYMIMPTSCLIMVIYTTIVYRFSGQIFESSDNVLRAWRLHIIGQRDQLKDTGGTDQSREVKRKTLTLDQMRLTASPSLGIKVSGYYFIKLSTTVTYCSIIINNTISLLLAH